MRFSWGKIWFDKFDLCKKYDILQLCELEVRCEKIREECTH